MGAKILLVGESRPGIEPLYIRECFEDGPGEKIGLRKLSLGRETILSLDGYHLQRAAGGISLNTDCTDTNCCSGIRTCADACGGSTKYC